ncbi:MAG: hypothetical protein ACR2PW_00570 [Gammaproteobacteria bacterium]
MENFCTCTHYYRWGTISAMRKGKHSVDKRIWRTIQGLPVDKCIAGWSHGGKRHQYAPGTVKVMRKVRGGYQAIGYLQGAIVELVLLTESELVLGLYPNDKHSPQSD